MRDGLVIALSNRTPDELMPLMGFIVNNICKVRYTRELLSVSETIIDLYSCAFGIDQGFDNVCSKLL